MNEIKEKLKNLPQEPGVYIMHDDAGTVIYVGKAKSLRNRVSQYFNSPKNHTLKTSIMVQNIDDFEYIVTDTELEALVLECNLIKRYMPKYNILLKDDKGYPYIKVTGNEPFPRVVMARRIEPKMAAGVRYFGPYLNNGVVYETLDIIKKIFQIRDCGRSLPRDIGKERPCLNYSIKQCCAPCNGFISQEDYGKTVENVCDFLSGNYREVTQRLEREMQELSQNMEFERAAKKRDKILAINKIKEKQKIISTNLDNKDVISLAREGKYTCVQVFFVRNGKMIGRENYFLKADEGEKDAEIIADFVKQYYALATEIPRRIVLPTEIEDEALMEQWLSDAAESKISIICPKRGVNTDLVNMVTQNAREALQTWLIDQNVFKKKADSLLFEVKELLGLANVPMHIEAYDISNISGADSVGVRVVFRNAKPQKGDYRKYNIRSVTENPDDYESIREVLERRAARGLSDEEPMPDLMLIDGGRGHVSAAREVMEKQGITVPIFGLVKDEKHRTRGVTTEKEEVALPVTGKVFRFFTRIQDEVHRFALASHQQKHKNSTFASVLMKIPNVGKQKQALLLKAFGSLNNIKNATIQQLSEVKGIDAKTAENIYKHLNNKLTD
ncbi:MAG: excinuclease ABC subunit UvrC [Clostridiales bacterium]|nr:excinuclease ABC subunit UvrC [Clostridiales bacterium]